MSCQSEKSPHLGFAGHHRLRPPNWLTMLLLAYLVLLPGGCMVQTRVVYNPWDQLPADPKTTPPQTADRENQPGGTAWAIAIEHFTGVARHSQALALSGQISNQADLPNLWIEDDGRWATLYCGNFADPRSLKAQDALQTVRQINFDQQQPFANARLVPLQRQAAQQNNDPHNIAPFAGFYSLQIAYYDDQFDGDRHTAAEQAVNVLRQEGVEAYYYHGPNRSMVTIGLLTREEAFVTEENPLAPGSLIERWSPAIRALQEKHPYNLGNGLTLIEKVDGKKIGEQPSSLVQIPTQIR